MKVYEAVLDQLIGGGVRHFAGMVGSTSAPYVGTLAQRNDVRYIGIRHEQVAAAMMDATARLSGRPGCVMTHGASGLLAASLGGGWEEDGERGSWSMTQDCPLWKSRFVIEDCPQ